MSVAKSDASLTGLCLLQPSRKMDDYFQNVVQVLCTPLLAKAAVLALDDVEPLHTCHSMFSSHTKMRMPLIVLLLQLSQSAM